MHQKFEENLKFCKMNAIDNIRISSFIAWSGFQYIKMSPRLYVKIVTPYDLHCYVASGIGVLHPKPHKFMSSSCSHMHALSSEWKVLLDDLCNLAIIPSLTFLLIVYKKQGECIVKTNNRRRMNDYTKVCILT